MRLLRVLMPLVAGVMAAVMAPSALAAFPGTNGQLVIAPAHGPGLALIDAQGHGRRTICTAASLCGSPAMPHFAPDGQQIAFWDRKANRPVIVASDGTCLWCLLGRPLTRLKGSTPAFQSKPQTLSFSSGQNLWTTTLTGGSPTRLITPTPGARGPISAAVWSPTGDLAFVRGGAVWLTRHGHAPHDLGPGSAPTFSPDARRLALVRRGWIWAINLASGKSVRIVRGAAPAFSPDGRSLAFIAGGASVYVVAAHGGRPRLLPGVQARALDWQPVIPASSGRCSIPSRATVVAQSSEAVITYMPSTPSTPWYGCLQATGHRWPLVRLPSTAPGTNASLGQIQLAGRFAAFVLTTTNTSMSCSNAVSEVDLALGAATSLYSQSCTASSRGVDSLGVDSSGFSAWRAHEQVAAAQPLTGVACPSSTLCVTVDGHGLAATSTSPGTAGSWSLAKVAPALTDVRCPSTTLCIGLDGGMIVTSTNPAGGASAWSAPVTIDSAQLADVSCPSAGLCVAVDNAGNVLTSTNPTGGAGAWQLTNVDGSNFLSGISCPSSTLCVAVGQNGDVLTSTHPTAGAAAWSHSNAESTFGLLGVSCPSIALCVSTDSSGNVLSTTNPAGGGAWSAVHVPGEAGFIYQPVCPSSSLCLARDGTGNVLRSTNPASPTATWTATNLAGALSGLSCVRATGAPLCAASDTAGQVHVSAAPGAGGVSWSTVAVDVPPCGACVEEQLYARDDRAVQALDAVQPGPGNVLANIALSGDATVISWTHGGAPRSHPLR